MYILAGIGIALFVVCSPIMYIYYAITNNWNVFGNPNDDNFVGKYAKLGFIAGIIFVAIVIACVFAVCYKKYNLARFVNVIKHKIFYKEVKTIIIQNTNANANTLNPVTIKNNSIQEENYC
jgi:hypothetical protein